MMELKDIQDKVTAFLTDELEIDADKIHEDARLKEDMGIDSLEVVDVVVLIDQEFGFKMKAEDFKVIKTFGELCEHIARHV